MPYLVDRQRAIRMAEVVAVIGVRQRRARSRVIFKDNSLYHTLTRTKTFLRRTREEPAAWLGAPTAPRD